MISILNNQCSQLEEANRAWSQYFQTQLVNLREQLQPFIVLNEDFTWDESLKSICQHIFQQQNQYQEQYQILQKENQHLRSGNLSKFRFNIEQNVFI